MQLCGNFVCIVWRNFTGFTTIPLSPHKFNIPSLSLFIDHDRARDLGHGHAQDHALDHDRVQSRQCSSRTEVLVEVRLHQVSSECSKRRLPLT